MLVKNEKVKRVIILVLTAIILIITPPTHAETLARWQYDEFYDKFSDIVIDAWYVDDLIRANIREIMQGYPDGTMRPNANVTYGEFITMAVRNDGRPEAPEYSVLEAMRSLGLSSLDGHWAMRYAVIASGASYIDREWGWLDKLDMPITRVDAASVLSRVNMRGIPNYRYDNIDISLLKFSDADRLTETQKKDIQGLYYTGTFDGYPDGTFRPFNNITRAEAAKIILLIYGPNLGVNANGNRIFIGR